MTHHVTLPYFRDSRYNVTHVTMFRTLWCKKTTRVVTYLSSKKENNDNSMTCVTLITIRVADV